MHAQGFDRSRKHSQDKVLRAFLEQMTDTATPGGRSSVEPPAGRRTPGQDHGPVPAPASRAGDVATAATQFRPGTPQGIVPTPAQGGRASSPTPQVVLTPAPDRGPARDTDLTGTLLADKYRLVRLLGRGGVGEVYEAIHELIGLRVAVKLIRFEYAGNPELAARFLQEARAAASVGHPGIVQVQDVGTSHDGRTYLVMEYLEGEDLEKVMRRQRRMPVGDIVAILTDVLEALEAAHRKGIVHRDLKPENIYLAAGRKGERNVKLLDFGIARLTDEAGQTTRLTQPGAVMGTPFYMSPEQARGDQEIDAGVDIYAAGVMLFEALTGRLPFLASSFHQVLTLALTAPFPSARALRGDLPEALERVIFKATARERARRHATAAEFAADLAPFRPHQTTFTPVDGEPPQDDRPRALTSQTPLPIPARTSAPPPRVAASGPRPPAATPTRDAGARAPADSGTAPPPRRRSRPVVWVALGLVGVALVAGGLVLGLRQGSDSGPRRTAAGAAADTVNVRLQGVPNGAEIRCDGRVVGPQFELPAGPTERTIEVRLPGRPPLRRVVQASSDLTLDLQVDFAPTAPAVP
jgi:serine/threonine-protein kinase